MVRFPALEYFCDSSKVFSSNLQCLGEGQQHVVGESGGEWILALTEMLTRFTNEGIDHIQTEETSITRGFANVTLDRIHDLLVMLRQ